MSEAIAGMVSDIRRRGVPGLVERTVGSFHPRVMPRLTRGHYRRELAAWTLLPVMVAAVEGGVAGALVKIGFESVADEKALNFAVAAVAAAPAFANVTSFLWSALSHGRDKIRFMAGLQIAAALAVAAVALAPRSAAGLMMIVLAVVAARVCWAGVVTIRSTVWRQNYPDSDRARLAGKLATIQSLMMLSTAALVGWLMDYSDVAFRVVYPAAAVIGLVGVTVYRRMRVRGHRAMLNHERAGLKTQSARIDPVVFIDILRRDRPFRLYMLCMFVFGFGNLMVSAPLIIVLRDVFGFGNMSMILLTVSIPFVLIALSIPRWSRFFDRVGIVHFRSVHSWVFVVAIVLILIGTLYGLPHLFVAAAVVRGIAFGGGILGWNLGHHDFSTPAQAGHYMGVHVTLTGLRGIIAPVLGVSIYQALEEWQPGSGGWVFAVCLGMSSLGAMGFGVLRFSERHDGPR